MPVTAAPNRIAICSASVARTDARTLRLFGQQTPEQIGVLLPVPEQTILFGVLLGCILQRRCPGDV